MLERHTIGAYWGNRKESAADCAERATRLLRSLARIDEVFARWFETGWSLKQALSKEVRPDGDSLRRLFEKGRNRRDDNRAVIQQLGFRISIWNGSRDADESVGLTVGCGCYASTPVTWIPNTCVVSLPKGGLAGERILRVAVVALIVSHVVSAMDPDWGVVASNLQLGLVPEPPPGVPRVGWMTYLSARYGEIPESLSGKVKPMDKLGSLIVTTQERFTVSNPVHVAGAERIRDALDQAGLLRRLP